MQFLVFARQFVAASLVQIRTNRCASGYPNVLMSYMPDVMMPCSADCRVTGPAAFLSAVLNSIAVNLIMMQTAHEVSSIVLMLSYLFDCPMTQCLLVKSQIVPAVRPFKQVQRLAILCIATDVSLRILDILQVVALASQNTRWCLRGDAASNLANHVLR